MLLAIQIPAISVHIRVFYYYYYYFADNWFFVKRFVGSCRRRNLQIGPFIPQGSKFIAFFLVNSYERIRFGSFWNFKGHFCLLLYGILVLGCWAFYFSKGFKNTITPKIHNRCCYCYCFIDHFLKWRRISYSFCIYVNKTLKPHFGLNALLYFAHGIEVRNAY